MPLGIVAWVMGNGDLKEMDAGRMDDSGRGMTQVGKIQLGMVATILAIVGIAIWFLFFFLMIGAAAVRWGCQLRPAHVDRAHCQLSIRTYTAPLEQASGAVVTRKTRSRGSTTTWHQRFLQCLSFRGCRVAAARAPSDSNRALKFPLPKDWLPRRQMISKNSVGRS